MAKGKATTESGVLRVVSIRPAKGSVLTLGDLVELVAAAADAGLHAEYELTLEQVRQHSIRKDEYVAGLARFRGVEWSETDGE